MKINFRNLKKDLLSQGWKVELTNSNHWRFTPPFPDKKIVVASSTPSCPFAIKHVIGDLKRNGFIQKQ
jgi:hypothetical protein